MRISEHEEVKTDLAQKGKNLFEKFQEIHRRKTELVQISPSGKRSLLHYNSTIMNIPSEDEGTCSPPMSAHEFKTLQNLQIQKQKKGLSIKEHVRLKSNIEAPKKKREMGL